MEESLSEDVDNTTVATKRKGHEDHEVLANSSGQADEMEQDTDSATGLLDFSSVIPVCVARKTFHRQQVYHNSSLVSCTTAVGLRYLSYFCTCTTAVVDAVTIHAITSSMIRTHSHISRFPRFDSRLLQDPMVGAPTANNFVKGASFSPDGTCLLTSSDDAVLRVFEVPSCAFQGVRHSVSCTSLHTVFFLPALRTARTFLRRQIPACVTRASIHTYTEGHDMYQCIKYSVRNIDLLPDIFISERARLVHSWHLRAPTWTPPPSITCPREPFSLFCYFILCACVCAQSTAPRASPAPSRVSAACRGGVGRSAVAVFVARHCVSVDTRGKHPWALSGLLVWGRLYYVRVYEGHFGRQNKFQAVFFLRPS